MKKIAELNITELKTLLGSYIGVPIEELSQDGESFIQKPSVCFTRKRVLDIFLNKAKQSAGNLCPSSISAELLDILNEFSKELCGNTLMLTSDQTAVLAEFLIAEWSKLTEQQQRYILTPTRPPNEDAYRAFTAFQKEAECILNNILYQLWKDGGEKPLN